MSTKEETAFQSSEVLPCGGSCLTTSIAFWANLGEINARYSPFGVSAQLTTVLLLLSHAPWVQGLKGGESLEAIFVLHNLGSLWIADQKRD